MSDYVENVLVFWVRGTEAARESAMTLESGISDETGLGEVLSFVRRTEGTELEVVHPRPGTQQPFGHGIKEFAVPNNPEDEFGGFHCVRFRTAGERIWAEQQLTRDPNVSLVHRPAIFRAPRTFAPVTATMPTQWALDHCGFNAVGQDFIMDGDPGPIAMIDIGPESSHPDLRPWMLHHAPVYGSTGGADHGVRVASIIAARPSNTNGMRGCCPATVHLFCVHNEYGYHAASFFKYMRAIADRPYRVLNVSLEAEIDPSTQKHFRACANRGVNIVAGMGNEGENGNKPSYPASDTKNVIAVGGSTGAFDRRSPTSSKGCHIWLVAPGVDHTTIDGDIGHDTAAFGTSFAAPMVSSAVWLMLSAKPSLTRSDVKRLLADTAASSPPGGRDCDIGHGRLDLRNLKTVMGI